jgi:hypothetical protein
MAGLLAGPCCAVALVGFALRVPGYHHLLHPPALLGAAGMPDAFAWNLLGFILPGLLAAVGLQGVHRALRRRGVGFMARLGATLLLLSTVAFAGQGLVSLQLGQAVDAGSARLHVALWMLWWLAALAGFVVLALGSLRRPAFAIATLLVAALLLLALHATFLPIPGGLRERIALSAWFGWIAVASWRARRQP